MGSRDQVRNLEIFKVGADAVNEFEFQKNQGELSEQQEYHLEQPDSASGPATEAERIEQVIADAHAKVEERKRKGSGNVAQRKSAASKPAAKKPAAKKPAARKPARKAAATAKKAAKKSAKKAASKKSVTKVAARKSTTKKATKKSAAKRSTARKR
ncbi:MAG: hypothetical protein WAL47_09745 [Pyrinomonadaceae bacterium]